jgi:hypothetical protein
MWMTRLSLPAPNMPPARADMRSAVLAQPAATDGVDDLSLTVIVERHHRARRFAFRASRLEGPPSDGPSRDAPRSSDAFRRHEVHDSARFLAGAIAQTGPGTVLHNPLHREATIAYRRSDALGVRSPMLSARSDKRI